MRVADLFCGPGGISEGLRQAGFSTVYALDKDRAAVETFRRNHPEAVVERRDVTDLNSDELPEFDILVGGPPCVEFSLSKGGRRNILEGLRLVQAFLRVVYERQPKYWIMENVPRIVLHLPEEVPLKWIGVDKKGSLHVPLRQEFNCADYGVPQARRRFLLGSFPIPGATHVNSERRVSDLFTSITSEAPPWRTLGEILRALPDPLLPPSNQGVTDPIYGFSLPQELLSDHFHEVVLSDYEVRSIRAVKTAHPYMGVMAFPDTTDRPARTVVATQLGRETLVIEGKRSGEVVYRRATVRECATLQSFPITYQFWGGGLGARYRLAGDAVPPRLAYLIGREIRLTHDALDSVIADVRQRPIELSPKADWGTRRKRSSTLPANRKFSALIPGKEVRGCRAEFGNQGKPSSSSSTTTDPGIKWCARLYVGEGRQMRSTPVEAHTALLELRSFYVSNEQNRDRLLALLRHCEEQFPSELPDASTLHAVWTGRQTGPLGPEAVSERLCAIVNEYFPKDVFERAFVPRGGAIDIVPLRGLRIRIGIGLAVAAYAAEVINRKAAWNNANHDLSSTPNASLSPVTNDHDAGIPRPSTLIEAQDRKPTETSFYLA